MFGPSRPFDYPLLCDKERLDGRLSNVWVRNCYGIQTPITLNRWSMFALSRLKCLFKRFQKASQIKRMFDVCEPSVRSIIFTHTIDVDVTICCGNRTHSIHDRCHHVRCLVWFGCDALSPLSRETMQTNWVHGCQSHTPIDLFRCLRNHVKRCVPLKILGMSSRHVWCIEYLRKCKVHTTNQTVADAETVTFVLSRVISSDRWNWAVVEQLSLSLSW